MPEILDIPLDEDGFAILVSAGQFTARLAHEVEVRIVLCRHAARRAAIITASRDTTLRDRFCNRCGRPYRGSAVFCSDKCELDLLGQPLARSMVA